MGKGSRSFNSSLFRSPYRQYLIQSKEDSASTTYKNLETMSEESDFINSENGNIFFDSPGSSIQSTQQVNIDYSKFENHTFFDSATSKVNISIDNIINNFPYDGTKEDFTTYMVNRTGFDKYVFDNFNKSFGYIDFKSSSISVKDISGNLYPDLSRNNKGETILSPRKSPFTVEFSIKPAQIANNCQTIFQFSGSDSTISAFLSKSDSTSLGSLHFHILSGTQHAFVSSSIRKDKFSHVAFSYPAGETNSDINVRDQQKLLIYVDGDIKSKSSQKIIFDDLSIPGPQNFIIGSGSKMYTPELEGQTIGSGAAKGENFFLPLENFSGSLDEFRYYHKLKTQDSINKYRQKNVFNEDSLKLYFKFNEIVQENSIKDIVIDSSGNSLHSKITNYNSSLRYIKSGSNNVHAHMVQEQADLNPVLFFGDSTNSSLSVRLLASASLYDDANPNLITKLIPNHYFLEGESFEGLGNLTGSLSNTYDMKNLPGSGKLGTGQLLMSFLLIWAKHFDQLKIFIDTMSKIHSYGLQEYDVTVDNFLIETARKYGLELPDFFGNIPGNVFNQKTIVDNSNKLSNLSLQKVQNMLWKRILSNYQSILKQKGTISSIKQIIRSTGIDPDNLFSIREIGSNKKFFLEGLRENNIIKSLNFLDFSGSIGAPSHSNATRNNQGFAASSIGGSPFITSSLLIDGLFESEASTGIRYGDTGIYSSQEKYFPDVGPATSIQDKFLTSGSFTYEAIYKFDTGLSHFTTQSLCRIAVTGSTTPSKFHGIISNLLAIKDHNTTGSSDKLRLYMYPTRNTSEKLFKLDVNNVNIFNGKPWYISFGRARNDDPFYYSVKNNNLLDAPMQGSASYYLRCSEVGNDNKLYSTSSLYGLANKTFFEKRLETFNTGTLITIGSQSIVERSVDDFLNYRDFNTEVRSTHFSGKINFIKFFSNSTTDLEARERSKNPFSLGTDNPQIKYSNIKTNSKELGAFNRLRVRTNIAEQFTTSSNTLGKIKIFDFSQNGYHFQGNGFEANTRVLKKDSISFSRISPKFGELQSNNKVRVRGFNEDDNLPGKPWAIKGEVFEISDDKRYVDDPRISIESSIVKSLDERIINIISSLETYDQILGNPSNLFESEYIGLENLRKQYFKDLLGKINLNAYTDFFSWFEDTMTDLISDFIPVRAKFLGVNNVIESHILERNKNKYVYDKMYAVNEYDDVGYFSNGADLGLKTIESE